MPSRSIKKVARLSRKGENGTDESRDGSGKPDTGTPPTGKRRSALIAK
jgi:hypothetical protein